MAEPSTEGNSAQQIEAILLSDLEWDDIPVGRGGQSVVFKGRWIPRDKTVAIKKRLMILDTDYQEVKILAALDHPNIIKLYGVAQQMNDLYIVSEFADKGSLHDCLILNRHHREFSIEEKLEWAWQIAEGMKYLHQQKIIHRDLKPKNVLMSGTAPIWSAKVCDLGTAKEYGATTTATLVGTRQWMAPEVVKGEGVSLSCDVYSYGMLLWELLTCKEPFSDTSYMLVPARIASGDQPNIPDSCESYLAQLMKTCWDMNPKARPTFEHIISVLSNRDRTQGPEVAQVEEKPIPKGNDSRLLETSDNEKEEEAWSESESGDSVEPEPIPPHITSRAELDLKEARKRRSIAQELLNTERTYVDHLQVIAGFHGEVMRFNGRTKAIPDSDIQQMFLNTDQIYSLSQQILEVLVACMEKWSVKESLGGELYRIAPFFLQLHSTYNTGYMDAMKKLTDWRTKDKNFDTLVRETERKNRTGLGVAECMLEPVKRLPRYKNLLLDYLKYMPEDAEDRPATEKTLGIISEAADVIKDRFKELANSNEILSIQHSLQHYEGTLLVPSRVLIKKGTLLKVSRKSTDPRMFFLFSDILLHTAWRSLSGKFNDTYTFKNEMPLFGMRIEEPTVSVVPFSFSVHSTTRSFILAADSYEEKQEWMDALVLAIKEDRMKRMSVFTPVSGDPYQEFGTKAPIMVSNKSVTMCQHCCSLFTFTSWRHHCKACGKVVCGNCSSRRAFLPYMHKSERVCEECYCISKANSEGLDVADEPEGVLSAYDKQDTVIAGYILCLDGKRWNRLWCQVKRDFVLYKFKAHEDIKAIQSIPLMGYIVVTDRRKENILNLKHVSGRKDLCEVFKIENATEFDSWVSVLQRAVYLELPTSY